MNLSKLVTRISCLPLFYVVLASFALLISGCTNDDNDAPSDDGLTSSVSDEPLIEVAVEANMGGIFTSEDGRISIEIPPDALSESAMLQVTPAEGISNPTTSMRNAGRAIAVSFGAQLLEPAVVRISLDTDPIHPDLAETALIIDGQWQRSSANYFRPSENTVVSLVDTDGTLQPVFRTLQSESGDQVERGKEIFHNATFGNEQFFGGVVGLQEVLNNVTPATAISVGAQVNVERVPANIVEVLVGDDFAAKQLALDSLDITRALLRADAVVGVKAFYDDPNSNIATSVGITCALCHATVTPTEFEIAQGELVTLPIGPLALDGLPNTGIDVGTILSLTPFAINAGEDTVTFLQGFGAGQFDARALPDNPLDDGVLNPTSIPPLRNFVDLHEQNYLLNWDGFFRSTEDPDNAIASRDELVYDLVMHANGAFGTASSSVPLEAATTPTMDLVNVLVAAEDQAPGNVIDSQSLLDLQSWERSLVSPAPGDFDEALAEQGFKLFHGQAQCDSCHLTAEFTGPVFSSNIVLESPQGGLASGIKTPGLRGVRLTAPYFHDGSAATLEEVVEIYSERIVPLLNANEVDAIAEYMRSL